MTKKTKTKTKKAEDPKDIAWRVFREEYDDLEIQERYDRFIRNRERLRGILTENIESYNEKMNAKAELESLLMKTIKKGLSCESIMLKTILDLEKELAEESIRLSSLSEENDHNEKLIKNYEVWSEKKLFEHWRYLRAFDPEVGTWVEFRDQHKRIF